MSRVDDAGGSAVVSIDPEALAGVIADLERTASRIRNQVAPLRYRFSSENVPTTNIDRLTDAADKIDGILPDLRSRLRQARAIAKSQPGVTTVTLGWDFETGYEGSILPPAPPSFAQRRAADGATVVSFPTPTVAPTAPTESPEPPPPEEPPLLSIGGLKKLGGDFLDWGAEQVEGIWTGITEAWGNFTKEIAELWESVTTWWGDLVAWWDDVTAKAGEWIDKNLAGLREWIRQHALLLRIVAIALKVVGWILVAVGVILFILGLVLDLTGVGAIVGLPAGAAALAIAGVGLTIVGVGDGLNTLVDWGEGKIDGQQLVQELALNGGITLLSYVGIGAIGRIFKALPASLRTKITDWIQRILKPGSRPKVPEVDGPPKAPEVDGPPKTPDVDGPPKTPDVDGPPKVPDADDPPKTPPDAPGDEGFTIRGGTPGTPRVYLFRSPAWKFRKRPQPTSEQLEDISLEAKYRVGTEEHLLQAWVRHRGKGRNPTDWETWRDQYIVRVSNWYRGKAYENAFWRDQRFRDADWAQEVDVPIPGTGSGRRFDIASATRPGVAFELKVGPGAIKAEQIENDKLLIAAGWEIRYVFGSAIPPKLRETLESAGIKVIIWHGKGVPF